MLYYKENVQNQTTFQPELIIRAHLINERNQKNTLGYDAKRHLTDSVKMLTKR